MPSVDHGSPHPPAKDAKMSSEIGLFENQFLRQHPDYIHADSIRSPKGRNGSPGPSPSKVKKSSSSRKFQQSHQHHGTDKRGGDDSDLEIGKKVVSERFDKFQMRHDEFRDFPPHDLYMHLSARVQEVLACAEAMWEWVVDDQARWQAKQHQRQQAQQRHHRDEVGLSDEELTRIADVDGEMKVIRKMTRHEFDNLLFRFEMYDLFTLFSMPRTQKLQYL